MKTGRTEDHDPSAPCLLCLIIATTTKHMMKIQLKKKNINFVFNQKDKVRHYWFFLSLEVFYYNLTRQVAATGRGDWTGRL